MKIGFTGTRDGMTDAQYTVVSNQIWQLESMEFHHGKCKGADEEAAAMAFAHGYIVIAHPPRDTKHIAQFESDIELMPKDYIDRNHDIVDECDVLIAAPKTASMPTDLRGQGTWSTVNYAIRSNKRVIVVAPDGLVTEYNA